jgi:cation:H+ antiporter
MDIILSIGIIILASLVIYFLGNKFAEASSNLGDYFKLAKSVKGATFDAIASSMPELMVALFSVIIFHKFEVGIGTIAGSALFNLLIIPGLCVLVAPKVFKVSKEVISRDALFYIISVFVLLVLILYFKVWGIIIAIVLILIYLMYVLKIISHTKKGKGKVENKEVSFFKNAGIFLITMIGMGFATYFLTGAAINFSEAVGISPIIIAFTVIAAATSIPDTVISVVNAKKGNLDDATSNVFGSNIFDILLGLGIPILIYFFLVGPVEIVFEHLEIVLGLLGATIMLFYFMIEEHTLSKKEGVLLLILYLFFIGYVIFIG